MVKAVYRKLGEITPSGAGSKRAQVQGAGRSNPQWTGQVLRFCVFVVCQESMSLVVLYFCRALLFLVILVWLSIVVWLAFKALENGRQNITDQNGGST